MLMLAGARRSSDQLGFWSHSKSAVVCRCRKWIPGNCFPETALQSGLRAPPSTAIMGSLSLAPALRPAQAAVLRALRPPRAPSGPGAGQPARSAASASSGGRERERRRAEQPADLIHFRSPSFDPDMSTLVDLWLQGPLGPRLGCPPPHPPQHHLGELRTGPNRVLGVSETALLLLTTASHLEKTIGFFPTNICASNVHV